jgi:hypothetical protein
LTAAFTGCDVVINLATALPPTRSALRRSAWAACEAIRTEGSAAVVDAALAADVGRMVQESVVMIYADGADRWLDEQAGYAKACADAVQTGLWVRVPGRSVLLLGDRLTSLTRSLRVSNASFRSATSWRPRFPSAREGYVATAAG